MSLACEAHKRVGWCGWCDDCAEAAREPLDHEAARDHQDRVADRRALIARRAEIMAKRKRGPTSYRKPYEQYVEKCQIGGRNGADVRGSIKRLDRAMTEAAHAGDNPRPEAARVLPRDNDGRTIPTPSGAGTFPEGA